MRVAPPRVGPFRPGLFRSALHSERVAAALGIWLGVAFVVCFVTGLLSHVIQRPPSWFTYPARPVWLYRVTQGVHVATGLASIPLLLAKLWVVSPRLWTWPSIRSLGHLVERASLLPLVGGSLFLLFTGIGSINRLKPWSFSFPAAHYAAAWIAIGALVVHVSAKLHVAARALARASRDRPDREPDLLPEVAPQPSPPPISRRGFVGAALAGAGAVTLATVGQTVRPFRTFSVLAPRDPAIGPQGVPVNKTARSARVEEAARSPDYRLELGGNPATAGRFTLEELRSMPQRTVELPITCVDGWSATGAWTGIPVRELLERAGADPAAGCEVVSLQRPGAAYASSRLAPPHALDPDTLLALELNGGPLALDHGYPLRLIAPNRPGVMQTKWVTRLVVP